MDIAILGLGRMGRELVTHLIDAGHHVTAWNRSPEPTETVGRRGARIASTPAEAVEGADAVLTVLFGPDAVREIVIERAAAGPPRRPLDRRDDRRPGGRRRVRRLGALRGHPLRPLPRRRLARPRPRREPRRADRRRARRGRARPAESSACGPTRTRSAPSTHRRRPRPPSWWPTWPSPSRWRPCSESLRLGAPGASRADEVLCPARPSRRSPRSPAMKGAGRHLRRLRRHPVLRRRRSRRTPA